MPNKSGKQHCTLTTAIPGVQEVDDAVRKELLRVSGNPELIQLPQHGLTLIVLAEIFLPGSVFARTVIKSWQRLTASRAIRAWISYTSTVNSFLIRCT